MMCFACPFIFYMLFVSINLLRCIMYIYKVLWCVVLRISKIFYLKNCVVLRMLLARFVLCIFLQLSYNYTCLHLFYRVEFIHRFLSCAMYVYTHICHVTYVIKVLWCIGHTIKSRHKYLFLLRSYLVMYWVLQLVICSHVLW